MLEEVGALREQRKGLQHEIAELFEFKSKYGTGVQDVSRYSFPPRAVWLLILGNTTASWYAAAWHADWGSEGPGPGPGISTSRPLDRLDRFSSYRLVWIELLIFSRIGFLSFFLRNACTFYGWLFSLLFESFLRLGRCYRTRGSLLSSSLVFIVKFVMQFESFVSMPHIDRRVGERLWLFCLLATLHVIERRRR
jgi:hypothetical protein